MDDYKVEWVIEVSGQDPADAALEALDTMRDPGSSATFFTVTGLKTGRSINVDLEEFSIADWQHQVAAGNTVLGYRDWVRHAWESGQD